MNITPRLLFYAADRYHKIVPLDTNMEQDRWVMQGIQSGDERFTWDAPIREISKYVGDDTFLKENLLDHNQTDANIIILFVHTEHLRRNEFYENLLTSADGLRRINTDIKSRTIWKNGVFLPSPIIIIGEEDVMKLYAETTAETNTTTQKTDNWTAKRNSENRKHLYDLHIDHRVKFLDSSIWNRYVPNKDDFQKDIIDVLRNMIAYWNLGLYRTNTGLSSLEFQSRMFLNSYIFPVGNSDHQDAVTPFKFHSESDAKERADKIVDFFKKEGSKSVKLDSLKWNLLMIDDQAQKSLSSINDKPDSTPTTVSKADLISFIVSGEIPKLLEGYQIPEHRLPNIHITGKTETGDDKIIEQGINLLKGEGMFDIILLDYLLGHQDKSKSSLREYGHEFLLELEHQLRQTSPQDGKKKIKRGPLGRYWIFPISSFPFAFGDKLRQLSIDTSSEYWHISNGGDPVNAPEQFRWNFYQFLLFQVSRWYMYPEALARMVRQFDSIDDLNLRCRVLKRRINFELVRYKSLIGDEEQKSAFATSMKVFLDAQLDYQSVLYRLRNLCDRYEDFDNGMSPQPLRILLDSEDKGLNNDWPIMTQLTNSINVELHRATKVFNDEFQASDGDELRFEDRKLTEIDPVFMLTCRKRNLKKLILNHNALYDFPYLPVVVPNLERLELRNNQFEKIPASLKHLKTLKYLDLRGNPVEKLFSKNKRVDICLAESRYEVEALLNAAKDDGLLSDN